MTVMTARESNATHQARPEHGAPDFAVLRERAHNLRWATVAPDVIPLTAADPDLPVASCVTDALTRYLASPHLSYGPAAGLDGFRHALAGHFAREKQAPTDPERVTATNSAASALALVARHLLVDGLRPGDEVLVEDPVDFLLGESARRAGATVVRWRRERNGCIASLARAVTPRTRALFVCHPHNPLGMLWSPDEVRAVAEFAAERGLRLLSDEVWSDTVLDGRAFRSFAAEPGAWVVHGLSKGFGLAGLRIGAVVAPSVEASRAFRSAQGFDHTIEGASTLSQIAAEAALRDGQAWRAEFLRHCAAQRDLAIARLGQLPGARIAFAPEATFVLFVDISATGLGEDTIAERLERIARVKVVPGSPRWFGPGAAGHIRLSLATTHAVLDEALARIERAWTAVTDRGDA
jgi:aspartate/methionine/tyrosine aminotransferase